MKILLTNDDGINAPGLVVLHKIALKLTNAENIITVAPAFEQSGVGHCITYTKPLNYAGLGENRFAVEGSPADCVLAGIFKILDGEKPDLILSGVNRGNNAAQNTFYSGTVGATIEAAMHGVKSVALSQFFGPDNRDLDDPFEASLAAGPECIQTLIDAAPWGDGPIPLFYNVNFPPCAGQDVKGSKATIQGFRSGSPFHTTSQKAPNGRDMIWIQGTGQHERTAQGTDVAANIDGYTSITPCRVDLTAHDEISALQQALT